MTVDVTVYDAATGRRLRGGYASAPEFAQKQVRDGEAIYLGKMSEAQYVAEGQLVDMPARPSEAHFWDWPTHAWQEDLAPAIAAARDRIEAARVSRTTAPIAYDGASLDADLTAQANVSAKLQEIAQCKALGQDMPAELRIWRDADNQTHSFDSLDAYDAWLGGLAIAITRRGTEVYAWAWAQKDALDNTTTLAAIAAFPTSIESTS